MPIPARYPSIASSMIFCRAEMMARKGVAYAGRHSRGASLLCALLFATVAASNAGAAETDPESLPDSLYWEVSMPAGYVWMMGCGEMGAKKTDIAATAIAQPSNGIKAEAHASHHPGGIAAQTLSLDAAGVERTLAELSSMVNGGMYVSLAN